MNIELPDVLISLSTKGTAFSSNKTGIVEWDIGEEPTGEVQPTQAEIDAEMQRLQAEYDNNQYQRDRQYPPIGDQLDMIYHAGLGGDEFQAAIKAVKDEFPKPE